MARQSITPAGLREAIEAGRAPTILDVRSEREFAGDHVPGAINIPFHQLGARLGDIRWEPGDPLVVYCGHGPRAWIAARALRAHGFSNVLYLKGHWAGWKRATTGGRPYT